VASSFAFPRDRLDRATIKGLFAEDDFLGCHGLSGDVGMGRPVITREEIGSMMPTLVAVDAFVVDVESSGGVLGVTMM
jgi:hypothetical protein